MWAVLLEFRPEFPVGSVSAVVGLDRCPRPVCNVRWALTWDREWGPIQTDRNNSNSSSSRATLLALEWASRDPVAVAVICCQWTSGRPAIRTEVGRNKVVVAADYDHRTPTNR